MNYADEGELHRDLEHVAHNLTAEALEGRYRVDGALTTLQHIVDSIASSVHRMEISAAAIAEVDGAIGDVRRNLEAAAANVYQAARRIESVL